MRVLAGLWLVVWHSRHSIVEITSIQLKDLFPALVESMIRCYSLTFDFSVFSHFSVFLFRSFSKG